MESQKIYEESLKEIIKLSRSLGSDKITIDFSKIDSESAGVIRSTLSRVLHERSSIVTSVIMKVE